MVFGSIINILILADFTIIYIAFVLMKDNFWVGSISSLALIVISLVFLILTAADLIITLIYYRINNSLKKEQGYPAFISITIHFERYNRPTSDQSGD